MQENNLINFIDLTESLLQMVLSWRNEESIRLWMHNKDIITIEEHLKFVNSLKNSKDKKYLLVKSGDDYIGVLDFTKIDIITKTTELGIYVNPKLHKKGYGKIILNSGIQYALSVLGMKKIKIEVYKDNLRAIRLYESCNFVKTMERIIDNKILICMELNLNMIK